MVVSFIGGGSLSTRRKPSICYNSLTNLITKCYIEYTSPWAGFDLTTSAVICTDCTCSFKSNYDAITTTMAPRKIGAIFKVCCVQLWIEYTKNVYTIFEIYFCRNYICVPSSCFILFKFRAWIVLLKSCRNEARASFRVWILFQFFSKQKLKSVITLIMVIRIQQVPLNLHKGSPLSISNKS